MVALIIFILGTVGIVWLSVASLRHPGSHGFYRFFAWEFILGMFVIDMHIWFVNPFAWYQIISWVLLIICLILIFYGVFLLRTVGRPAGQLEATTHLVTNGIYQFIRHLLYASLLYLAWGIFFKSPSLLVGCLAVVAMAFLYATARADEFECKAKFGEEYGQYMAQTKMFVPFLF